MITAIIGVGNIGSAAAQHLVDGGEAVVLSANTEGSAGELATRLGERASAARSQTRSHKRTRSCSPDGSMRSRS
jgi:predicted dinucleotide-binding enzyme